MLRDKYKWNTILVHEAKELYITKDWRKRKPEHTLYAKERKQKERKDNIDKNKIFHLAH